MIFDVPTGDNFKSYGIDYLNLAWSILLDLLKEAENTNDFLEYLEIEEDRKSKTLNSFWERSERAQGTALVLIQQGMEFLLKGRIASVSPYLLIDGIKGYPKSSQTKDVRFSEFKTLDAQDLIRVHNTVFQNRLTDNFLTKFKKIKDQRNSLIHTFVEKLNIERRELIASILEISHSLIEPTCWTSIRKDFIDKSYEAITWELDEYPEYDYAKEKLSREMEIVVTLLTPTENFQYFGIDKKNRYICPVCYFDTFRQSCEHKIPKLAKLSTCELGKDSFVHCIICQESSKISRRECSSPNCSCNVIEEEKYGICLNCAEDA